MSSPTTEWMCLDEHTYICDQCTIEPSSRPKPTSEKPSTQQIATSSSLSRVTRFFRTVWNGPSAKAFRCSFCGKKQRSRKCIGTLPSHQKTVLGRDRFSLIRGRNRTIERRRTYIYKDRVRVAMGIARSRLSQSNQGSPSTSSREFRLDCVRSNFGAT